MDKKILTEADIHEAASRLKNNMVLGLLDYGAVRYSTTPFLLEGPVAQLGCDPELFISTKSGRTVGSEVVIPKDGIRRYDEDADYNNIPVLVQDGVQVELHTYPDTCRASISNQITHTFRRLQQTLEAGGHDLGVNFSQVIELSDEELAALSEQARQLGCKPSQNVYGKPGIKVDGSIVRQRSASGHIHIGANITPGNIEHYVRILDTFVGNTSVLIDRDPRAAERRKLYGRAGEYRKTSYGLEYRTLSNFWLLGYPIMSLMFGLVQQAYIIGENHKYTEQLMKDVDLKRISDAIDNNDFHLAKANFDEWVRPFVSSFRFRKGLAAERLEHFDHFVKKIDQHGIKYWFPDDPVTHWATKGDGHGKGWETFCGVTIADDIIRDMRRQQQLLQGGI